MSPPQEKAAAIALGLASAASGVFASILSGLQTFGAVLAILSIVVGLGGGLLALYIRKLIRDREEERSRDRRLEDEKMDARFRRVEEDHARTREMIQKAVLQYENLAAAVARNEGSIHDVQVSLNKGNERFARLEGRLIAMGRSSKRFSDRDSDDG